MPFHWTGTELVMGTFAGTGKLTALRARPAVPVTIDTAGPPPQVLLLRRRVKITEQDGIVEEYALAHHRYYGPEQGAANGSATRGTSRARPRPRSTQLHENCCLPGR